MTPLQAIVLGLVQGLGEFLPISSSAHLVLVPWFFNWTDPGLGFDVALHWGTLIGVVIYYRKDVRDLLTGAWGGMRGQRDLKNTLPWMVALATVPAVIAGLLLENAAETTFRSPRLIAFTLAGVGLLIGWVDRRADTGKSIETMTFLKAFYIGVLQCFAIVPGVSRSGITIVAALFLGFDRSTAVRFSFLLSIPIIAGAGVLKVGEFAHHAGELPFWLGLTTAAVSGFAAIHFLVSFVRSNRFTPFVVYRLALAGLIFWMAR